MNCILHLPVPFSIKSLHIAAAAPEQSISGSEPSSQDLEQSRRELASLMVDVAHHDIPAARFKFWTRLIAAGVVQGQYVDSEEKPVRSDVQAAHLVQAVPVHQQGHQPDPGAEHVHVVDDPVHCFSVRHWGFGR